MPLGYATAFATLAGLDEVRGGTPWGAGTFTVSCHTLGKCTRGALTNLLSQGADGSRMPSEKEIGLAKTHGESFYKAVSKVNFA